MAEKPEKPESELPEDPAAVDPAETPVNPDDPWPEPEPPSEADPGELPAESTEPPTEGAADPVMQFFAYHDLPEEQQPVARPFASLANRLVDMVPRNAERTIALRRLLEARDAALRAKTAR